MSISDGGRRLRQENASCLPGQGQSQEPVEGCGGPGGWASGTDLDTGRVPRDVWHVSIRVASPSEFLPPL